MKKALLAVLFCLTMISFAPSAMATGAEFEEAAMKLYDLGLFNGTGTNLDGMPVFDLNRAPTRHEAVTMLVRLLGKEEDAKANDWDIPFSDVAGWAKPYVGYAYNNGLTNGISPTMFGGDDTVSSAQYITFILRALGYESGADFKWDEAWILSDELGITSGEYSATSSKEFLRGDVAIISYNALSECYKDSDNTLKNLIITTENPSSDTVDQEEEIADSTTGEEKEAPVFSNLKTYQGSPMKEWLCVDEKYYNQGWTKSIFLEKYYYDEEDVYANCALSEMFGANASDAYMFAKIALGEVKTSKIDNPYADGTISLNWSKNAIEKGIESEYVEANSKINTYTFKYKKNELIVNPAEVREEASTSTDKYAIIDNVRFIVRDGDVLVNVNDFFEALGIDATISIREENERGKVIFVTNN